MHTQGHNSVLQTPVIKSWSDLAKKKTSSSQHRIQHLPEPLLEREAMLKKPWVKDWNISLQWFWNPFSYSSCKCKPGLFEESPKERPDDRCLPACPCSTPFSEMSHWFFLFFCTMVCIFKNWRGFFSIKIYFSPNLAKKSPKWPQNRIRIFWKFCH